MSKEMRHGNITQCGGVLATELLSPANVLARRGGQTLGYPKAE